MNTGSKTKDLVIHGLKPPASCLLIKKWQQMTNALASVPHLDVLDGADFTVCELGERTADVSPKLKLLIISVFCSKHMMMMRL